MELNRWFEETRASELMVELLVTFSPADTVGSAAQTLLIEQISGAPVLDDENRCVGVLALSDLIRAEDQVMEEQLAIADSSFFNSNLILPKRIYAQRLDEIQDQIQPVQDQPISRFMTRDVVSVGVDESLASILHKFVDAHIHRVLVVDEHQKLLGIISTIDVLAALLRASR